MGYVHFMFSFNKPALEVFADPLARVFILLYASY